VPQQLDPTPKTGGDRLGLAAPTPAACGGAPARPSRGGLLHHHPGRSQNRRRNRQRLAGVRYLLQGLLVCSKCGYAFCGRWQPRYPRQPGHGYHYYRCCGTESNRFDGQRHCDARVIAVEALDAAVWAEVCRLLEDPARVLEEYQRRLQAARTGPHRPEEDMVGRQLSRLRRGIGRLIDSYAEELIDRAEFEPRIAELRQRVARLEVQAAALREASEQSRSLQLVIGKLESFAELLQDRLDRADWSTRRDIIRTLVRRIEIEDHHVRVVFRVGPEAKVDGGSPRLLQHCPVRHEASAGTSSPPPPTRDRRSEGLSRASGRRLTAARRVPPCRLARLVSGGGAAGHPKGRSAAEQPRSGLIGEHPQLLAASREACVIHRWLRFRRLNRSMLKS
jgi:site-specific DNA recombinase